MSMWTRSATRLVATSLIAAAVLVPVVASPAAAGVPVTVITVTTTTDVVDGGDGLTSLREAVSEANAAGTPADIVLAFDATYPLSICPPGSDDNTNTTGDLDLTGSNDVTVTGNGATIDQTCPGSRHFDWTPASGTPLLTIADATLTGVTDALGTFSVQASSSLTLDGTVIDNNSGYGAAVATFGNGTLSIVESRISRTAGGSAILDLQTGPTTVITGSVITDNWGNVEYGENSGVYVAERDLVITSSVVSENRQVAAPLPPGPLGYAELGDLDMNWNGAIAVPDHTVTVSDSTIHHNAGVNGGGISADTAIVTGSTFTQNFGGAGGAINAQQLTVSASSFATNSSGLGGGAIVLDSTGPPTSSITDSTFVGNRGGGAVSAENDLVVRRSTITGNAPSGDAGPAAVTGYGWTTDITTLTILESTVSGNQFTPPGPVSDGTAEVSTHNTNLVVRNSVIGSSTQEVPACDLGVGTSVVSQGHNFDSDGSCGLTDPTDTSNGGEPLLGALADNGGVTETMLPLPGSPLLDAVPPATPGCVGSMSQNGLVLPQGLGCEIGAAEVASTARLAGTVTAAYDGSPLPGIEVRVRTLANTPAAMTTTGPDGTWTIAGLAAGDYKVLFRDPSGDHNQTFNGSAWPFSAALPVTVTTTNTAVVDQALTADNTLGGTVTSTETGLPIAGVQVRLRTVDNTYIRTATTNASGAYTFTDLAPGDYKLLFRHPTGAYQQTFNGSAWPFSNAPPITIGPGDTITADQAMVPVPAITGTVTQEGTGTPLAGIEVRFRTLTNTYVASTTTAADGTWTIHLPANTYKLLYTDPTSTHLTEWHDNKPGFATATPLTHTQTATIGLTAALTPTP